jgi:cytosine/adenosine deaminase-related metal-dependent hydrolase
MLTENRKKLTVLLILVLGLCLIALVGCDSVAPTPEPEEPTAEPEAEAEAAEAAPQETYKILYIMSYHSPWKWTDDQLDGFKYAMRDSVVEYKVFQMDTKRNDSEEWIAQVSQEAKDLIDSWQPDLVFTSDDNVQ